MYSATTLELFNSCPHFQVAPLGTRLPVCRRVLPSVHGGCKDPPKGRSKEVCFIVVAGSEGAVTYCGDGHSGDETRSGDQMGRVDNRGEYGDQKDGGPYIHYC